MLSITEQTRATNLLSVDERSLRYDLRMSIGRVIAKRRKALGLSQRALATMLGVSNGAVAQWEIDQTKPDPANRSMLAVILGVDAQSLQTGDAPFEGELVKDTDELALLGFWRSLDRPDRAAMIKLLFGARRGNPPNN